MKLRSASLSLWLIWTLSLLPALAAPLTTLEYRLVGTQLQVTPALVSVPKTVAGSVLVQLVSADGATNAATASLAAGAYVEATLRGPSFEARRLVGQVNQALLLPPLSLVGDYQLDNIRLVDAATGAVRMEATPSSVPVRVFDEVLVSRVTSRPLTVEEIKDKGIVIDEKNFRAVEFEVGFVVDGKTVPVKFPVVAPSFQQSTEIIPQAELERRLAQAQTINQQIALTAELPEELQRARLNIQIEGINFQEVEIPEQDLRLTIPPIPALMVIPGNIGYLHQFFSVQIFTENAAPRDSALSVFNLQARLNLPPGPDRLVSTNYDQPGDDPLRFARIGPDKVIQPTQPIVRPGPDGQFGTADDIGRLYPGESGQGEFLVEGLQEGLHVLDLTLTADLAGLAAGPVKITGKAAGSVLVRNPKFSLAFSHPRTVRAGEPYEAFATILNTSLTPANFVSVNLSPASLSGGVLESDSSVQLGTILPGQTATAKFRVRAQRTGAISFSNLTTGDDSVQGRFRLSMGIDERGIALSPDTIGMPDYVNALPTNLLNAVNRVLGQALSVATAAQLPPSVKVVTRSAITRRVLELAEAGQRVRYGDALNRVLSDLLLDWQGGRATSDGFDQILRETDAGREFRLALAREIELADNLDGTGRLLERAPDLAGRSEAWIVAGASDAAIELSLTDGALSAGLDRSDLPRAAGYRGARGNWLATVPGTNQVVRWQLTNALPQAEFSLLLLDTNGAAQALRWSVSNPPANACYRYDIADSTAQLQADTNCDGFIDSTLTATTVPVAEHAPQLLGVLQDTTVDAGRPIPSCIRSELRNYGTVLAVLFSKPMTQDRVNVPGAYLLDNGNSANSVQIQPGGRVALLNMRLPVSAIRPRTMTISGLTDARGNPILNHSLPVQSTLMAGVALRGLVTRADGSPAAGIPVTLTMYDEQANMMFGDCDPFVVRVCQVNSDTNGFFEFDFAMSGIEYSVSATDTAGLTAEATALLMEAAAGDTLTRNRLLALANSPSAQNTLLAAFAVGALPEAIVAAEGIDRTVLRDKVLPESPRQGTITPVALRFRGRGTVMGQVVQANGTPAPGAAVNLFPAPDSREQGRGIFADSQGRFAFGGVPLGVFTIQAQDNSGTSRTISSAIAQAGDVTNLVVTLSAVVQARTALGGRVSEAENGLPHANAQVFVGRYVEGAFQNVVAAVNADANGYWTAHNIPVNTYDVVAISLDGKRKTDRQDIAAAAGVTNYINLALPGTAVVVGRVESCTGVPLRNALVAGGETIVRTDTNGLFRLTGVPTGQRTISAGLERNPAAGVDFPRLGSASLEVVSGIENYVVVRLNPAGRIVGRVLDAAGQPVPNVTVAMPMDDGFRWVRADSQGNYKFENVELREWTLSAPSGAVAERDVTGILETLRTSASEEEIQAAIGEAFGIFTGANDPYLNGTGATFNPLTWGFTKANLVFDGQTAVADIRYLRQGTISGKVLNGQGVPIGVRVRLTGLGPLPNGMPAIILRGERNSDPATGTFEFPGQALAGPWGLQAATPFYPTVLTLGGVTSSVEPDATNLVLQFPPTAEVNGRLTGFVFAPDGSPAGSNVSVKISFGNDYVIGTGSNGFFDTQMAIPKGDYSVEAHDPLTGFRGIAGVTVVPGVTNVVSVHLLAKGALAVTVQRADGSPAPGAQVRLEQGSYPGEKFQGATDINGVVAFQNIFEGSFAVNAQFVSGPTTISGRAGAQVQAGQTAAVTVRLAPTGRIRGTFVQRDTLAPVAAAQIAVGELGFTTTDTNGLFEVSGVPLGTYRLLAQNPLNGVGAIQFVSLNFDGEIREVQLVEQARAEVVGAVINSYGTGYVAGATVTLTVNDGLTPARTVTTGPDGRFSFPATPAGAFQLNAVAPLSGVRGSRSGVLPPNVATYELNVPLQSLATLAGIVYRPDGLTPATNCSVQLRQPGFQVAADTDAAGRVTFADLPLGSYFLVAASLTPAENRSAVQTNLTLVAAGPAPDFAVILRGVGSVSGRVFDSDGATPAAFVEVNLVGQDTALTDENGHFQFGNIAPGPYRLTAQDQALASSYNGVILTNGQTDVVILTLGSSGAVAGRLVRSDGSNAVAGIDVLLTFNSQSGLPGRAFMRSANNGWFQFDNIPLGPFTLEAIGPDFGGIARLSSALTTNGQALHLGDVPFDEADPSVIAVTPAHSAAEVSILAPVDLVFSEALAAASVQASGIYLRAGTQTVASTVQLLSTNQVARWVRITPNTPLRSLTTYEVVVLDGDRVDAFGGVIGRGPRDLVDRPLPRPFISRFTTADQDPPVLVSLSPSNNAVQIDPRSLVRLSFNEPIRGSNFTCTLTGPAGPVAGTPAIGVNGLVLVFTPAAELLPNSTYTLTVSGVQDLAGNLALQQPYTATFTTLDTLGPNIATLRLGDNRSAIAASTVPIEAVLATNEPGATVRFTADFAPLGSASLPPYRVNATLPATGSVTFRAIATDRYGNDGPLSELTVAVVSNQPPVVQLVRGQPAEGPIGSGQTFTLLASATDDLAVTNITLIGQGALTVSTNAPGGETNVFAFVLPTNTVDGRPLEFRALATDALGVASAEVALVLETADATPPAIAILGPTNNALLDPTQPLVLSVAGADNSTNYLLELVLSGSLTATQTLSVVTLPNTLQTNALTFSLNGAPTNGVSFVATLRATDAGSNSATLVRTFYLPDSTPPTLLGLTPADGATKVSVLAPVEATFSEPLSPASVQAGSFTLADSDGQPVPGQLSWLNQNQSVRFQPATQLAFGSRYTLTLDGAIADLAGNGFAGLVSTFTTVSNLPPLLTFERVTPAAGPIGSGQSLTLSVGAVSDLCITNLAVVGSGAIAVTNRFGDGALRPLHFTVPADTLPATPLQFEAFARDAFGGQATATLVFEVIDRTPPALALLSPSSGTRLDPAQPLAVAVASSDNAGDHQWVLELSGGSTATQTVNVVCAPNQVVTNTVQFSLAGIIPDGSALVMTLRGADAATNTAALSQNFRLIDRTGPHLVAATPVAGATRQSLWLDTVTFQFSEAVDPATVTTNNILFTNNQAVAVPYRVEPLSATAVQLKLLTAPLTPGTTYSNVLLAGLTDLAGNGLIATNGAPLTESGPTFTTAAILSALPTNGTAVQPGQNLEAAIHFDPGIGADFFRFILDGGAPLDVPVLPGATNAAVSLPVPGYATNVASITLTMAAMKVGAPAYELPPVSLNLVTTPPDTNFVTIAGSSEVVLTEGQSTNLIFTIEAPDAPVVLVDYSTTNAEPPCFIALSTLQMTNHLTSGTAAAQLTLNPLHDAAGTYALTLRAAAKNGKVGTLTVLVTVLDNPALQVTRWKDPVDGFTDDPARWTAGVPGSNNVAVVDLPGTYTVRSRYSGTALGFVFAATNATVMVVESIYANMPMEIRAGRLTFDSYKHLTFTITRPLVNRGELCLVSRYYTTTINGAGLIENSGLITAVAGVGGMTGSEGTLAVPVHVTGAGRLVLPPNAWLRFPANGSLRLAGALEAPAGARLRFENDGPVRDLTVLAGAQFVGEGTLRLEGSNRLLLAGDAAVPWHLELNDTSAVVGNGSLRLLGQHTVYGHYATRLEFASNAVATVQSATFGSNVLIEADALVAMHPWNHLTLTLNGVLTNRGTFRQVANYYTSTLAGSGRIENEGLMDLTVGTGGYTSAEASLQVPLNVAVGGCLLLNTNGSVRIRSGGGLTVAGTLEVQSGARLREENDGPARYLSLRPGARVLGTGTLRLEGANQLLVEDRTELPLQLDLVDSSVVSGKGVARLTGTQAVYGNYAARLEFASNAVATVQGATLGSNVLIEAGALVAMHPWNHLTLTIKGPLTNRGTLRQVANYYTSTLVGSGRIENEGLMDFSVALGGNSGAEATVALPVHIAESGRFLMPAGGNVRFRNGGTLAVTGQLEVQTGGRVRLENDGPARDLTALAGAQFSGDGTLRFDGANRFFLASDASLPLHLELNDSSVVTGPGLLTVLGAHAVYGHYAARVQFATNAQINLLATTFDSNVVVEAGGLLAINPWNFMTVTLNGVLTNRGTFRQVANYYVSTLAGTGRIENEGVLDFSVAVGGNTGAEANIHLPLFVASDSLFLVPTNGRVRFREGGTLTLAGAMEVQTGGRVRFEWNGAARDLTLLAGGIIRGPGTTEISGPNRLVIAGDATLNGGQVNLFDASTMAGTGRLTIRTGTTLRLDHSLTFPGSVDLFGTVLLNHDGVMLDIGGTLTLEASGVLRNPGTVRVGAFVNLGGTIIGNTPVTIGGAQLKISNIQLGRTVREGNAPALASSASNRAVTLNWSAAPGGSFLVEVSDDLARWVRTDAVVQEVAPGQFKAVLEGTAGDAHFFRLQRLPAQELGQE